MRKLLMAASVCLITGSLWASCIGPYCWDESGNASFTGTVNVGGSLSTAGSSTTNGVISGNTTQAGTYSNTGGITVSTLTVTGTMGLRLANPTDVTVTTPTVVGEVVRTSTFVLYIGTATNSTADWIKVGGQ